MCTHSLLRFSSEEMGTRLERKRYVKVEAETTPGTSRSKATEATQSLHKRMVAMSFNWARRWTFTAGTVAALLLSMAIVLRCYNSSPSSTKISPRAQVHTLSRSAGVENPTRLKAPHIVLLLADDLGHNDLGFSWRNGGLPAETHGRISTPHIDTMVNNDESTILLTDLYSMPMCTPSRAALLTGIHPTRLGLHHFVLLSSQGTGLPFAVAAPSPTAGSSQAPMRLVQTLPEMLKKQHGYRTHLVGKWHLGFCRRAYLPTRRGFDSFFGFALGAQDYWTHDTDEFLSGRRSGGARRPTPGALGHDYWRDEEPVPRSAVDGIHGTTLIRREAATVIEAHSALMRRQAQDLQDLQDLAPPPPTPLFLYVASQAPHAHHTGAPREAYGAVDSASNENGLEYGAGRREVAALVVCLDDLVGHLRRTLVEQDMWDDTLFIFASDNGPEPPPASLPKRPEADSSSSSSSNGESAIHETRSDAQKQSLPSGGTAFPFRGRKRTVWEGGVKSVAFLRVPPRVFRPLFSSSPAMKRFDSLIHFVDFAPTLLEAAAMGAASHLPSDTVASESQVAPSAAQDLESADGVSFWGALQYKWNGESSTALPPDLNAHSNHEGMPFKKRTGVLLQFDQVLRCGAIRRGHFKLVWNGDCGNAPELFGSWDQWPFSSDSASSSSSSSSSSSVSSSTSSFQSHSKGIDTSAKPPWMQQLDDDNSEVRGDEWLLFDLETDPLERFDLSEALPDLHAAMKETMLAHGDRTAPALTFETPGDDAASPALHSGKWVSWLGD